MVSDVNTFAYVPMFLYFPQSPVMLHLSLQFIQSLFLAKFICAYLFLKWYLALSIRSGPCKYFFYINLIVLSLIKKCKEIWEA